MSIWYEIWTQIKLFGTDLFCGLTMIIGMIAMIVIMRLVSVRMMFGHWPHQSDEAMRVFKSLP